MITEERIKAIMRAIANRPDGLAILRGIQEHFQEIKYAEDWIQLDSNEGPVWMRVPSLGGGIVQLQGIGNYALRAFNGDNLRTVSGFDHAKCLYNWYLASEGFYLPEQPVYDAWTLTPDMLNPRLVASHENGDVLKSLDLGSRPRFYVSNRHAGYESGLFPDVWSCLRETSSPVP